MQCKKEEKNTQKAATKEAKLFKRAAVQASRLLSRQTRTNKKKPREYADI